MNMGKIKLYDAEEMLKKDLKDPEFKKEYDALEEEFTIAKEVINLRLKAGLTQKQLAEKAGTSQPAIARLESGSYDKLSLTSLRKIGNALGAKPVLHFKKIKSI